MLMQNGSLFAAEPINRIAGTDVNSSIVGWGRGGSRFNRWYGHAFDTTKGNPDDYTHPNAWTMPLYNGGLMTELAAAGALTGSGAVAANATGLAILLASLTGSGDLIPGEMISGYAIAAALSGSGDITSAIGYLSAQMEAALTGQGTLAADVVGVWNMVGTLTGTSSFAAAVTAIGFAEAYLTGVGALLAETYAQGFMTADIVVTGDLLTAEAVADRVWSAIAANNNNTGSMGEKLNDAGSASNPWTEVIESGFTAAEILRLLAAVMAGKSSGGASGATTVVFRDLGDTKDRLEAAVDGSGNRTTVTRDAT